MSLTNHERVGKALDLLKDGLVPFAERELRAQHEQQWFEQFKASLPPQQLHLAGTTDAPNWDAGRVLKVVWDQWNVVFRKTLGQAERSLISELRDVRNRWAHQQPFSSDDAYRALDSVARVLTAVSAPQSEELEAMRMELLRVRFDEQARTAKRKSTDTSVRVQTAAAQLTPWREVVTPHPDVASGRYQQAEFAADLWQVHLGEGADEYRDPVEFFRRTFLTESLQRLLVGALERLTGGGGDPVVQLQTNFGGGKTHSMLALYHLFSGASPADLVGVERAVQDSGVKKVPTARRVVLVGNKISPGNPVTKPDGTEVRTLWGELAWQLGFAAGGAKEAKKAFARIRKDDENATSPGDALRGLFNEYGPCLVLIDEWVAYARQLHDQSDLPAGGFETQFSFAQALTESAKSAKNCLLVISLPASDTSGSPHGAAEDVEVGGQRRREALDRLRNVVGRLETSWRPASPEEGFEIVRRRLFQAITERERHVGRDNVAREFADMYQGQQAEFPLECRKADYEKRIKAAYPIHPEVFDRLYGDWSTLVKFQRTRGVLRLMAAVIHSLWQKGDRTALIMPSTIPLDDPRVQFELTRYLSDNWPPVIEKDIDGPNSLPVQIDGEVASLGKMSACRRVARTIFLGSAPTTSAANRGLEDQRVRLGCMLPGETSGAFGDALRRLAGAATYLYQDGSRYWYSTQPTVTKLAEDRAEQLKRNPDEFAREIERRLRLEFRKPGEFSRVHALPESSQDVPDDVDARLVVLGIEQPCGKEAGTVAEAAAQHFLETRGSAPRRFRNTLVFLAADKTRLTELDEAVRKYLAWDSILKEKEVLDLSPFQVKQAETQHHGADTTVAARIPETYLWLLVPVQKSPQDPPAWEKIRLSGQDGLAARAIKKLKSQELLITSYAGTRLRMDLDRVPLWRGDHVPVKQLVEDYASYPYLPRLLAPDVVLGAIESGVGLLSWEAEGFAYADGFDDATGRYVGLRTGQSVMVRDPESRGLVVKPSVGKAQRAAMTAATGESAEAKAAGEGGAVGESAQAGGGKSRASEVPAPPPKLRRYHGAVQLDATRMGRDASRIAEEIVAHLVGLTGARVRVTLEIEAQVPDGAPEGVVRTVTENSRTLKFTSHGFERE